MRKWLTRKVLRLLDREVILTEAVRDLYNTVGESDILKITNGVLHIADKPLSDGKKKQIVAEATQFCLSDFWKFLQLDLKYQANKKMFEEAQSEADLVAGKLWLYTIDVIRTRIESIKRAV